MRRLVCAIRGHITWRVRMGIDFIASPPTEVYAVQCRCGHAMYLTDHKEDN